MLFTDLSSERVVKAFSKAGFKIIKQGKHIGMSDGTLHLTIPHHKKVKTSPADVLFRYTLLLRPCHQTRRLRDCSPRFAGEAGFGCSPPQAYLAMTLPKNN